MPASNIKRIVLDASVAVAWCFEDLEPQNPAEEPVLGQDQMSTTDQVSTYAPTVARRFGWGTTTTIPLSQPRSPL
jgi:hypothetical protein